MAVAGNFQCWVTGDAMWASCGGLGAPNARTYSIPDSQMHCPHNPPYRYLRRSTATGRHVARSCGNLGPSYRYRSTPQKLVMTSRPASGGAIFVGSDIADLLAPMKINAPHALDTYMQLLALLAEAGEPREPAQGRFLQRRRPRCNPQLDVASSLAVWNYPATENQLPTIFETSGHLPEPQTPQLRSPIKTTKPDNQRDDAVFYTFRDTCRALEPYQIALAMWLLGCLETRRALPSRTKNRHGQRATRPPIQCQETYCAQRHRIAPPRRSIRQLRW
ncbi:hypothetical protein BKA58DRAFT_399356 [Alternaria rosae]|uniref:uncharacterized protein n=1 Tax=Alternaria rosae TaxID=1187941 RepID=UPI001E8EA73C|nr:uncharacterized protein BKA58DRAFT_399356 [Alternaria rosae]KAH6875117.1 hypothetical protein BKA58DRAFT_399356 [Alternaria rosae]